MRKKYPKAYFQYIFIKKLKWCYSISRNLTAFIVNTIGIKKISPRSITISKPSISIKDIIMFSL
jgi:hypothetical protein